MQITRKQFLRRLVQAAAGLVGVATAGGCSDGTATGGGPIDPDAAPPSSDAAPPPSDAAHVASCTLNGTISAIAANHGHVLVVSKADVAAGAAKTYDIRGTADHAHSVTVTTAMFTMLRGNTAIATTSSADSGHSHMVTVMCA